MLFDVDIRKRVASSGRVFELAVRFCADSDRIAVFGPSGAGKSLLLQMLAGLVQPDAGFIRVDGTTWFDARLDIDVPARQRRIGYVFQHYALFPHRTVAQNIAFSLATPLLGRMPAAARQRVDALLEMLGLTAVRNSYPMQLSGGERQRVALGRALASQPRALMLDEPFSSLDAPLRTRMRQELLGLQERFGVPYVLITHDAEDVATCSDTVLPLAHGRIVEARDAPVPLPRLVLGRSRHAGISRDVMR
jgi:molybdate transport system ATP-binding protein